MSKLLRFAALPLLFVAMVLPNHSFSQTVYENCIDGQIWFKLENKQPVRQTLDINGGGIREEDPYNLDLARFPFLKRVADQYGITNLSKPFHAAKNSVELQRTFELEFTSVQNVDDLIELIERQPSIEYAERVPLNETTISPNDTYYNSSQQWGLFQIVADSAWDISTGSSSIVVATVDNAIDTNHADLVNNIWNNPGEIIGNGIDDDGNGYVDDINGYDVGDNDNDPTPPSTSWQHGTHVAGITGATTNNNTGVASIGFGISMMAVKATANSAGSNSVSNGYDGIVYAASSGADVINCSWGGSFYSSTAQNVVSWAYNQGALVVAAAGNDGVSTKHYPAAYNNCMAVASTNGSDQKSSFSNYDDGTGWVDIAAPGSQIASTVPGGYQYLSGTSMASPMVSGLAGLMLSLNPSMPLSTLENCITSTADPVQGSYSSLCGAGRINAKAAMNCVSGTLNNPPVADFSANYTTITAGGSVVFTDQSTFGPTSWSWNFDVGNQGGVTPSTYNGQNPPAVTYSNTGTYTVSLTATNANGNDTETKTSYITVNAQASCDTLYNPEFFSWNPSIYWYGAGNGYLTGSNVLGDQMMAEYYPAATVGSLSYVKGAYVYIYTAGSPNSSKAVKVKVWDGTSATVGNALDSVSVPVDSLENMIAGGNYIYYVEFPNPVAVPASSEIFVGVDHSSLNYPTDSIAIVHTSDTTACPDNAYRKNSAGTWEHIVSNTSGLNNGLSLGILPVMTDQPAVATISTSATTICKGEQITYDATGSTYQDTLVWTFLGGTPTNSSNVVDSVIYNTAGSYRTYLQVVGGACGGYAIDSVDVTVNPDPQLVAQTTQDTICPGGSADVSASGTASSYSWDQGLGSGAGPHTVTPSSTTTYTVTGTSSAGCTSSASVTVQVDVDPTAAYTNNPTSNICPGQTVTFDATTSADADNYAWSFTNGSPATSSLAVENVTFSTSGTHAVQLIASNSCNQDTINSTITIDVCTGVQSFTAGKAVTSFYNSSAKSLEVTFVDMPRGTYNVNVVNTVGQHVVNEKINVNSDIEKSTFNMNAFSDGVYHLNVINTETGERHVKKFVKM